MTAFTNLTTMLVGALTLAVVADPLARPWVVRVGLLAAMVMAIVTSAVNVMLLDPSLPSGAWGVVDLVQHYVVPVALLVVWIVLGPGLRLSLHALSWALAVPFAWLLMTLLRGAMTGDYPYDFLDVAANGYVSVLVASLGILLAMLVLGSCLLGLDHVLVSTRTGLHEPPPASPGSPRFS